MVLKKERPKSFKTIRTKLIKHYEAYLVSKFAAALVYNNTSIN